jgi:hypothetical protein
MDEWHQKFALIQDRHARITLAPLGSSIPCFNDFYRDLNGFGSTFLFRAPMAGQTGATACFMSGPTPGGVAADCFGRAFAIQESALLGGKGDISVAERANRSRLVVELLHEAGNIVNVNEIPFRNFPELSIPPNLGLQQQDTAFIDYCVKPNQGPFFMAENARFHHRQLSFGDTIVFPSPGSSVSARLNVLLPNDKVGRIARIRASFKSGP